MKWRGVVFAVEGRFLLVVERALVGEVEGLCLKWRDVPFFAVEGHCVKWRGGAFLFFAVEGPCVKWRGVSFL